MTVLAKRVQSQDLCIWMTCEDDVNEGSAVLDVFLGLPDFRGVFKITILY